MVENLSRNRRKNSHKLFCAFVSKDIQEKLEGIPDVTKVIEFLVRHNIIRQSIINRYVVIRLYPIYKERHEKKDKAVSALSKVLPLEPTAIYNILSNHSSYFHPNNHDF